VRGARVYVQLGGGAVGGGAVAGGPLGGGAPAGPGSRERLAWGDADGSAAWLGGAAARGHASSDGRVFADGAVLRRTSLALALANARYWPTVAPRVRAQLARWERAAHAIPDPARRALALAQLHDKRSNVRAAATLATLAPRARRATVVEAIVAQQVAYDYLDALEERACGPGGEDRGGDGHAGAHRYPGADPNGHGGEGEDSDGSGAGGGSGSGSGGEDRHAGADPDYVRALAATTRTALARLPSRQTIAGAHRRAACRCAEAQALNHSARHPSHGIETSKIRTWVGSQKVPAGLGWRELLAGAGASVLSMHALIAAAATEDLTPEQADALDAAYLAIGALSMLDSLVDREHDRHTGQIGYLDYYRGDHELLARRLHSVARTAARQALRAPDWPHHLMTLTGLVAYYACALDTADRQERAAIAPLRAELRPLIAPLQALMRLWRTSARTRAPQHPRRSRVTATENDRSRP